MSTTGKGRFHDRERKAKTNNGAYRPTPEWLLSLLFLLQGLYILGNGLGVVSRQARHGLLVRDLLGIATLGEQIGDLIGGQADTPYRRPHLALDLQDHGRRRTSPCK